MLGDPNRPGSGLHMTFTAPLIEPAQLAAGLRVPLARALAWVPVLDAAAQEFGIDTPARLAMWLAQCAHESARFLRLTEGLSYSARRICEVWPKRFPSETEALPFQFAPQALANRVYALRMGNGPESSGDGWRYRGRGLLQLTGRDAYARCGAVLGLDLLTVPEQVAVPEIAARSAAWVWSTKGCSPLADAGDFEAVTRCINGGTVGIQERARIWRQCRSVFEK